MSNKQPRSRLGALTSPTARRVGMSLVIAGLVTTLVLVYLNRNGGDDTVASVSAPAPATIPPAALSGTYDVTVTVGSAEYGATWPSPQLTAGQQLSQRWSITCRRDSCIVRITSGHIVEDPDGAGVSTSDGRSFSVSGSNPTSPDTPTQPPGCGAITATDVQRLTLTAASTGATFTGRYELHHPTIHVEGVVGSGTGSCDSFNVVLDFSARRV